MLHSITNYQKKYSKTKRIFGACLVKNFSLKRLNSFLEHEFTKIQYFGETEEGTNITFENIAEILNYTNQRRKSLIKIRFSCSSDDRTLEITFQQNFLFLKPETIEYRLSYNDAAWGFKFEDELENELEEFKPWYSTLTYLDLTIGIPLLLAGFLMIYLGINQLLGILHFPTYFNINPTDALTPTTKGDLLWMFIVIPVYIISYITNKLRNYLFPKFFIAIGKQEKEFQRRKMISYILFGIIVIGILVNKLSDLI